MEEEHVLRPNTNVPHVLPPRRLAVAYLGYCVVVPSAWAVCMCSNVVVWSGVQYTFRNGKVHRVGRRDEKGAWYSESREASMEQALRRAAEVRNATYMS